MGVTLSEPFQVATEHQGHTTFVRLYGEFDLATEESFAEFTRPLGRNGMRRVVLDLRGLTFIDSSGVRLIISLWKRSQSDGFDLTVVRGDENITKVFEVLGLDGVLPVEDHSPAPNSRTLTPTPEPSGIEAHNPHRPRVNGLRNPASNET